MKRKLSLLIVLALLLVGCGKDGLTEYIDVQNVVVDHLNSDIQTIKDEDEFNEKIAELEAALQKIDDLNMSDENEEITDKILKTGEELVDCIKKLRAYDNDENIDKYNEQVDRYNELIQQFSSYEKEIK